MLVADRRFMEGRTMEFAARPAAVSGALSGVIMMMVVKLMKLAGMRLQINLVRIWGAMLGLRGTPMLVSGWIVHLIVSAIIGVAYAGTFRLAGAARRTWLWGLSIGVVHWIMGGFFLALVSATRAETSEERPAPGPFGMNFGLGDVLAFLLAHLVFGVSVGILYPLVSRRQRGVPGR
jgi:hypothetical protein